MNADAPTPGEAKNALMRLSLALPLFEIDGDIYSAATVATIGVARGEGRPIRLYVILAGTGIDDAIYYQFATPEITEEQKQHAVEAWKAALTRLYE